MDEEVKLEAGAVKKGEGQYYCIMSLENVFQRLNYEKACQMILDFVNIRTAQPIQNRVRLLDVAIGMVEAINK